MIGSPIYQISNDRGEKVQDKKKAQDKKKSASVYNFFHFVATSNKVWDGKNVFETQAIYTRVSYILLRDDVTNSHSYVFMF